MEITVGSFEAKTYFAQLLDRIEKGDEVIITRRGKMVARLIPVGNQQRDTALEAARKLQSLAQEMNLGTFNWKEWKKYRVQGRA